MQIEEQDVLKRIHYIEGHLGGIGKMIEGDASCLDVVRQTYAVRKAIQKLEVLIVAQYLAACVHQAIRSGGEQALLAELAQLYHLVEDQ